RDTQRCLVGSEMCIRDRNGITHFIEHTVFKGTNRRSAMEIAIEQDRLGGNLDAFTTHEETGFAIKMIDDRLPDAFDLLADMLTSPSFDKADLESEQRVIIEEIKMTDDSPEEYLGELFYAAAFPGHPLGLSIAGTPASVKTFGTAATREYHAKAFRPANLIIAAAGNVDHERILELAANSSLIDGGADAADIISGEAARVAAPFVIRQKPDLEQAHIIIATPFVRAASERRYAADLLANIIGGGTSSRLWQKVREERGLAYSVGSSAIPFHDCGIFSVSAGTSPEQAEELVDIVIAELRSVAKDGITDDELQLVKDQTRASILLGLEDSAGRAATLAHMELVHGRQIPLEESLERVEAVTVNEVIEVAREYFISENVAFAALGDLEGIGITRDRLTIEQ
ncbi:MAG: pitrilysin family protein, partial [Pyrinomonadaceae bacterium]|nr:pitrilysin family protein [Pyrinomonadaceae bacterium]